MIEYWSWWNLSWWASSELGLVQKTNSLKTEIQLTINHVYKNSFEICFFKKTAETIQQLYTKPYKRAVITFEANHSVSPFTSKILINECLATR